MDEPNFMKSINEKSLIYTEEKRLPQEKLSKVLKKVNKLGISHSPINSSKNSKAISSNIENAISLNKEYQKKFDRDILNDLKKLNIKFSSTLELKSLNFFQIPVINSVDLGKRVKLPEIKENFFGNPLKTSQETDKKNKKRSRSMIKKPLHMKFVQKIIEKCNDLDLDIQNSKLWSEKLTISRKNLTEFLLDSERYEKKIIDHKYNQSLRKYLNGLEEHNVDTSSVKKKNQQARRHHRIQFIAGIDSILHKF